MAMAALSRPLFVVTRQSWSRSISCCRPDRAWWIAPQPVKPLTDVPARMKGKAKKSHVPKLDESIMEGHVNFEALKKSMQSAVDILEWQFNKTITLRPTAYLLDLVKITDKQKRIRDVAQISQQKDAFIINCTQNPEMMPAIQDAVTNSNLGMTAITSGKNTIRVPLPKITGELRQKYTKIAKEASEKTRAGIRRTRGNGIKDARGLSLSTDDIRSFETQIDLLSKLYIERVDSMLKAKVTELTG